MKHAYPSDSVLKTLFSADYVKGRVVKVNELHLLTWPLDGVKATPLSHSQIGAHVPVLEAVNRLNFKRGSLLIGHFLFYIFLNYFDCCACTHRQRVATFLPLKRRSAFHFHEKRSLSA
jgi:hypothetical protein